MLQSSPARQLPPSISSRDPLCCARSSNRLTSPSPDSHRDRDPLEPALSIPPGWLRVTTTQELTKVTSNPSRPPSAHEDQVREGRKSYANILNIESLPGLEGENSQSQSPTCSRRMQGMAAPPAQGHSSAPVLPPVLFSSTRSHRGAQGVCESPSVPPLGWRYRQELLRAPHHISVHSFIFTYI